MNEQGVLLGRATFPDGVYPALWIDGAPVPIPGAVNHHPTAMSGSLHVVGTAGGEAFLWHQGTGLQVLARPEWAPGAHATAVNVHGVVVGTVSHPHPGFSGPLPVLWTNGGIIELPLLPNSDFAQPNAINDAGLIVGQSYEQGTGLAVAWCNGQVFDLNEFVEDPDVRLFNAAAIDPDGNIAGTAYLLTGGPERAFILPPVASLVDCGT